MSDDIPLDVPALIRAFQTGHRAALNDLFASVSPVLLKIFRSRYQGTKYRRTAESSDFVHEALLAALQAIGQFRGQTEERSCPG